METAVMNGVMIKPTDKCTCGWIAEDHAGIFDYLGACVYPESGCKGFVAEKVVG